MNHTTVPFDDRINDFVEAEFKRLRKLKMTILEAMDVEHNLGGLQEMERDEEGIKLMGVGRTTRDCTRQIGRC